MRFATRFLRPLGLATLALGSAALTSCHASSLPPAANAVASLESRPIRPSNVVVPVSTAFTLPYGVAADAAGNVYVADDNQTSIVKITPAGAQIRVGAGFNTPRSVAVDAAGNVYVADAALPASARLETSI
jgi:streptogramin lyase